MTLAEVSSYEGRLPDRTASVESGVATIRAVFAYGGVQSTLEAARQAAALDPELTSPWGGLVRLGLGHGLYLSGDSSGARKPLEEALVLTRVAKPLVRMAVLFSLSNVALDEGRLEEAEARAREACELVERFQLQRVPQATLVPIALGRVLAERGELEDAQAELENGLSARRKLPDLSPWPTLIGLLALARLSSGRGDRSAAQDAARRGTHHPRAASRLRHLPRASRAPGGAHPSHDDQAAKRFAQEQRQANRARARCAKAPCGRALYQRDGTWALPGSKHCKDPHQIHLPQARSLLAQASRRGGLLEEASNPLAELLLL